MHYSSLNNILHILINRSKNKKLALLWDQAEPITLEELKAKFAALARNEIASENDIACADAEKLTFEELWKIFESLEDLEDYPLIY